MKRSPNWITCAYIVSAIAGAIAGTISGCLPPRGDGAPEPTPTPPANVSAIAREAAQFPQRLAAGYAEEAESMAGRSGEFSDWEAFNRTWGEGNAKRRQAAFEPTARAIAEAVGGEEAGYDREKAAAAFRELANGLRGDK